MSEPCLGCNGKPVPESDLAKYRAQVIGAIPTTVVSSANEPWLMRFNMIPTLTVAKMDAHGVLSYPKDGPKPACPEGFEAIDDYTFKPLWPNCKMRMGGLKYLENKEVEIKMICNHPEAPHFSKFVVLDDCAGCPLRR